MAGYEAVGHMASAVRKRGEVNIGVKLAPFPWNGTVHI